MAAAILLYAPTVSAAVKPVTEGATSLRTGWYPDERELTSQLLEGGGFGQLFDTTVQGEVFAQPLVSGHTLFVVTEDNWIYGIDSRSGEIQWSRQVDTPWNSADLGCNSIKPHVGITGTPVIDPAANAAYFISKTYAAEESGPAIWNMHAIDLSNGDEVQGFPVQISGEAQNLPGVSFNPTQQLQRPGLLLMDGVIYAAFGSLCDIQPYQGWIAGVSTSGQIKAMWATAEAGAAIWQAGGGLLSDGPGQILFTSGNGSPPGAGESPTEGSLGESVVRAAVQPDGTLKATDFFSPFNNAYLDEHDLDLGSGTPLALPSEYFGTEARPNLLVQVGKQGLMYLLDRDRLGGMSQGPEEKDDVIQETSTPHGLWGSMAVWPGDGGYIYIPENGALEVVKYSLDESGSPHLSVVAGSSEAFAYGSGSAVVTSDGTTKGSGIVWISRCPASPCTSSTLNAYSAVPVEGSPKLLWSEEIGASTRFARPGVANGRIYVDRRDHHLLAFGATSHTLAVTRSGAGGRVGSDVPGIECGTDCLHSFSDGTQVVLTAVPDKHVEFKGWSGGGCSGTGSCNVTMYADTAVTATFTPVTHDVTVSKIGPGTGLVTSEPTGISCGVVCSALFDEGGNVTLTATPTESIVRWAGCTSAERNTCLVQDVEEARKVTAIFEQFPATKIIRAKINRRRRQATFRFSGTGTKFQCELIRPRKSHHKRSMATFSRCASPRRYRHLRSGHYTFKVRAVSSIGPDPTPATRKFKIG